MDKADFQEAQAMLDLYLSALGMQGSPSGKTARAAPKPVAVASTAGPSPDADDIPSFLKRTRPKVTDCEEIMMAHGS